MQLDAISLITYTAIAVGLNDAGRTTESRKIRLNCKKVHLHMVTPCAQSRIIKTTRNRVVEGIQCRSIMNSLDRDRFDVVVRIDAKVDSPNRGGHRTCESRHGSQKLPDATGKDFFFLNRPGGRKSRSPRPGEKLTQELFYAVRHRLQSTSGIGP